MRNLYLYSVIPIAFIALSCIAFIALGSINQVQLGLALLIILLGILPSLIILIDERESVLIPLMPLTGLFYAISFGVPMLSSQVSYKEVNAEVITEALGLTVLGLLFLYMGFYAFRRFYSKPNSMQFLNNVSTRRQIWIAWIMYGIYLIFTMFPVLQSIPSVGQFYTLLDYISLGLLFALALDNKLRKMHFRFLVLVLIFTVFLKILSGSLAPAFFLMVFLGVIYWIKKKTIPWGFILVGIIIVVGLNPVKHGYRAIAWESDIFSSLSYSEKATLFYEAGKVFYERDILSALSEDSTTINRVSHISTFAKVISMSPERVPYWLGGSYRTLLTSFIPRALWPDKPQSEIGQEFGHRYSLLHHKDTLTSYNLPWLTEFYANFGVAGVFVGMFAVGLIFRFLVTKMSAPNSQNVRLLLGLTITFHLFYAESNFALMVGGLLPKYIACLGLLWIVTAKYIWKRKFDH
jgi:hypothetical protein